MSSTKLLYLCFLGVVLSTCTKVECAEANNVKDTDGSNATAISEKKPAYYSVPFLPDDLSWRNGFGQSLAVGGIIVSSLVILGGIAWLLAPIFGYKICTLLGNCELAQIAHSNGGNLQDPAPTNNFQEMYNPFVSYSPAYRKRSLNYVGPILKTLAAAYDKYEHASTTKKD